MTDLIHSKKKQKNQRMRMRPFGGITHHCMVKKLQKGSMVYAI